MMLSESKILYISDLDGTLLNKDAELSEYTISSLNRMINEGLYFSVATARTAATCDLLLEKINLNMPIILMNGVLVYDFKNKKYIKKELLTKEKVEIIIAALRKTGRSGLMYTLCGDELVTYYEKIYSNYMRAFIDERIIKFNKKFIHTDNFADINANTIYFCFMDSFEMIHRLYEEIKDISELRIEKYKDIYTNGDLWYMEVFAKSASKYNAVSYLRKEFKFDNIVSFGDNLNDLPMFEASDKCYAVENANKNVKERASAIIGANYDNGVVKWLEDNRITKQNDDEL